MRILQILILSILLNISTFADDNKENKQVLKNLYENVVLSNLDKTLLALDNLKNSLEIKDYQKVKNSFKNFVISWKATESFYILGDINEDFIDTPRYIDIFHNGNEDITKQLNRAINSNDAIRVVLFKNSLKSINALEYILFNKNIKNERVNKIALTIVSKLKNHLMEVKEQYSLLENEFLKDSKKANSIVINEIVQNTYKLKEWRIGEVLGLTKKYEGNPDNKRSEYYLSKNSAVAIEAILNNLKQIFDNKKFEDYGDYLLKITDGKQVKKLREAINNSLVLVKQIKNDDFSNSKKLYEEVSKIHVILFLEIIEELSINAKILEADGD